MIGDNTGICSGIPFCQTGAKKLLKNLMKDILLNVVLRQKIEEKDVRKRDSEVPYNHLFFFLPHTLRC